MLLQPYTRPLVTRYGRRMHPLLVETIALIERDPRTVEELAEAAGMTTMGIYHWLAGNVYFPRKLPQVLDALGYRLVIVRGEYTIQ